MAAKKNSWIAVVVIILLAIVGWYWYMKMYPVKNVETLIEEEMTVTPTVAMMGEVLIERNLFVPETITIKVGETVTWINNESYAHDVVSDDGLFKSPMMDTGGKYSYAFMKEGTYTYICGIHPFMKGSVIVTK
jgi:amicyanin